MKRNQIRFWNPEHSKQKFQLLQGKKKSFARKLQGTVFSGLRQVGLRGKKKAPRAVIGWQVLGLSLSG